jgi:hypothetical protein
MKHDYLVEIVRKLASDGATKREITRQLGIPQVTLNRLCKKFSITTDGHLLHKICHFETEKLFLDEINKLYYDYEMSVEEIAEKFGTGYVSLFPYLSKRNFKFRTPAEWQAVNVPRIDLTERELEIIIGMLLGDGYLTIPRKTAYLGYTCHYEAIIDNVINNQLPRLGLRKHCHVQTDKRTDKSYTNYVARSRCFEILTQLRSKWYPNGVKIIPDDLVLTPEICYWWYLGDGSSKNSSLALCTNGFTGEDVNFLSSIMPVRNQVYWLNSNKTGKVYPMINITRMEDRLKFIDYIGPCRHKEYARRWILHSGYEMAVDPATDDIEYMI